MDSAPPGARLPSTRTLTREFGASPVTVQKAVRRLDALGLVESRPGIGTFVSARRPSRPADHGWQTAALGARPAPVAGLSSTQRESAGDVVALHSGYPARELLPERLVRAALARAARADAALVRSPAAGSSELRAWFAAQATGAGPAWSARDAVVVAGSQSGLSSVFRVLVGPGRPLVVESPTYWGAILAARQSGVVLVPVPSGPAGPDPGEVERAIRTTGARAFYAQPTFANPTGAQWPSTTAREVLEVVRRTGAFLVEDDWAHDLGIDTEPRPLVGQDDDGHVVYLRSLTKTVSPALRVAVLLARGPARERLLADRAAESMYVSGLLQAAALDVVTQPGWDRHLRTMRRELGRRRDHLLAALTREAPGVHVDHVPSGGLNLWARLPDGVDPHRLARECEADGLAIAPGDEWFPAEPTGSYVRLNYSTEPPERLDVAARILGTALSALS